METYLNPFINKKIMAEEVVFLFIAPAVVGLVIGLIELFFVHADENGMGWLGHGLHALPTAMIFTYISMNVPATLQFIETQGGITIPLWLGTFLVPIVIGIIAAIKVKAAAAIAKGGTVGESMIHALIIGALIAVAPFVWFYLLVPMGFIPEMLTR